MSAKYLLCLCLLAAALRPASATDCRAGFGEIIEMPACSHAVLPRFEVQFTGTSAPNPGIPLICWNYRITAKNTATVAEVSQCHTGELGGEREFQLDGKTYTLLFDLSEGCRRAAQGHWIAQRSGHAFLPGTRDAKAVRTLRDKRHKAESACYRRGQPAK
jgi:hypothetical protein